MRVRHPIFALAICCGVISCSCQQARPAQLASLGRRVLYYHDPMHPSYRSDRPGIAPDCNMELTPVYADESASGPAVVRLDEKQAAAIGLRMEAAREEEGAGEIRTVGRVQAEESQTYAVTAGADGWIRTVRGGDTGSLVAKGQALATYYSRDITAPQQAYLYAMDSVEHLRAGANSSPEQAALAAKQVTQARDYLEFLGMTGRQIADLEHTRVEGREVTLGAPAAGVVLERKVTEGSRFAKGDVLWEIAAIESVWITADLFPEDLASVSGARTATVLLPDGSERQAAIDASLPMFQTADRVGRLRLVVKNPGHTLLPGMTTTVRLRKGLGRGLTVPAQSVVESGINPRVFVRRGDGSLEARAVTTGWRNGGRVQILSGLKRGEQVAAAGAFLIDSESRIQEGGK
jgi:Cu(I)/Ag(I) efflux system membrane fusion protein